MLKTTQSKIILIICLTEIVLIVGLGGLTINMLSNVVNDINQKSIDVISANLSDVINQTRINMIIAIIISVLNILR